MKEQFYSLESAMRAVLEDYTSALAKVSLASTSKIVAHKHHKHGTFILVTIPGTKQAYCYQWSILPVTTADSKVIYYTVEYKKEVLL